jgi:DNA-binding NarL/FixJ family response regulator
VTAQAVRVLVVDDSDVFRAAAATVVERTPGFELVGTASSGEEAVAAAARLDPDLVLMDHRMPGLSGVDAAKRIHETHPRTVVTIVSADSGSQPQDGSFPVLSKKEFNPARLLELWRDAATGRSGVDDDLAAGEGDGLEP